MAGRHLLLWMLVFVVACSENNPVENPDCTTAAECDDGEVCTTDSCEAGSCAYSSNDMAVPAQAAAGDCLREICMGGGSHPVYDNADVPTDNVGCTVDSCASGTPVFTPDHVACDDASATCVNEQCDPANQNTNDGSGCVVTFNDAACNDTNICTDDACEPTAGGADAVTGCLLTPNAVDPPTIGGNCQDEVCSGGNVSSVNDTSDVPAAGTDTFSCTIPGCSGDAVSAPTEIPTNAMCDDGLACTVDTCDPTNPAHLTSGCVLVANDSLCAQGQVCDASANAGTNPSGCVSADTCPPSLTIADGQTVPYSTTGLNDDFSPSCANNTGGHPDIAFELVLAVDSDVVVTAHPTDAHRASVTIVEVSSTTCGRELLCAAPASGDAEIKVLNLAAGTYAIVVDGDGTTASAGTFTLSVLASATSIAAGDLLINEMLANPKTLADLSAEFFEIANPSATYAVGTVGLTLVEDDGSSTSQTLLDAASRQLIVKPGGFLLGVPDATTSANGGLTPDFDLIHSLNNTPNEHFKIMKGTTLIDGVDLVTAGFPAPTDGASVQLEPTKKDHTLNDQFANWCVTPLNVYEATNGNKGSPGAQNEACNPPQCTVPTQATDCNDNEACTDDVCVTGTCQNNNDNTNTPTPDAFSCTSEACVDGVRVITPNDLLCDDSVTCTVDDCVGAGGAATTGCVLTPNDGLCTDGKVCHPINDCQAVAPTITSVNMAVIAHGARLVLTGTAFTGATAVTVGNAAQTFVVDSSTQITISVLSDTTPIASQLVVVTTPAGSSTGLAVTVIRLLINELDSDTAGTDTVEFIEISTGVPGVNLTGYSLVLWNGGNDLSYDAFDLPTSDSNGLVVVGNVAAAGVDIAFPSGTLQNGPDAVALYQAAPVADNTTVTAANLIDALVYETNDADDDGLLDVLFGLFGVPTRVQVDEGTTETLSIVRCSLARRDGRAFLTASPTPNALNTCP